MCTITDDVSIICAHYYMLVSMLSSYFSDGECRLGQFGLLKQTSDPTVWTLHTGLGNSKSSIRGGREWEGGQILWSGYYTPDWATVTYLLEEGGGVRSYGLDTTHQTGQQ